MAGVGLYWRFEKWLRRTESRLDSMVSVIGCIAAVRRELLATLPAGTILDDVYSPLAVAMAAIGWFTTSGSKRSIVCPSGRVTSSAARSGPSPAIVSSWSSQRVYSATFTGMEASWVTVFMEYPIPAHWMHLAASQGHELVVLLPTER
jgi:hypothetical protein